MHAQVIRRFGDASVLEPAELPDPAPAAGEVLVRIHAASVNPADTKIRAADSPLAPAFPAVLGCDFAGVVEAVGDGVEEYRVGDAVYGCAGGVRGVSGGAYAELIAADARLLAPKPATLDFRAAAALPLVTITAWEALDRAFVGPDTHVLIHGGAGGVGHVAIQLARLRGARVASTVSSPEKAALARDFGAQDVIFYRDEPVADYVDRLTAGVGFDAVLDLTGGSELPRSFEAARLNGHVVTIVSLYEADLSLMHLRGLSLHVVFMLIPMLHDRGREAHGALLREAAALVDAGKLRPLPDPSTFTLADVAAAHRRLESGQATGKIVLTVQPG